MLYYLDELFLKNSIASVYKCVLDNIYFILVQMYVMKQPCNIRMVWVLYIVLKSLFENRNAMKCDSKCKEAMLYIYEKLVCYTILSWTKQGLAVSKYICILL